MYFKQKILAKYRLLVEAGRKDRYLQLFNPTSEAFKKQANPLIDWAIKELEKEDRIIWFLKKARLTDPEYKKKNQKEISEEKKITGGMLIQKNPIEWLKTQLEHYLSNAKINDYKLVLKHEFKDVPSKKLLNILEEKTKEEESKGSPERFVQMQEGDETFIKFPDGWEWHLLSRGSCEKEGKAMRHCGNAAAVKPGDRILSLREPVTMKGKKYWKPHATFIINDGVVGEMKGFANEKPGENLHPYIIKLLENKKIKKVKGGGYLVKNNFKFSDLSEKELKALEKKRPGLIEV